MTKKVFVLFTISLLTTNAFAIPSVKKLGVNGSVTVAKPVTLATPKKADNTMVVKSAKTPSVQAASAVGGNRVTTPPIKKINVTKTNIIKPVSQENTSKPVSAGVSEETFNDTINRIEMLENQSANAITDVVENTSGNYVTDVAVDGNKLNVNKTRLLYAPIRNADGEDLSGDAEIWIVK